MANIYAEQFFYSFTKMLTGIHGTIDLASSTTGVTATSINGATAARTGTGEITITLVDPYAALISAQFQVLSATAQDRVVQIKSQDPTSAAQTVVFRLLAGATATDPTSACTIEVDLMFRNSSITK